MDFGRLASGKNVANVIISLEKRGIKPEFLENSKKAMERIKEIIPSGASVMAGSSTTLEQIGFIEFLKSKEHLWKNLKGEILAEADAQKQSDLRRQAVLADYFLGSIQAVSLDGEILVASGTGSQLPAYAFTAKNVIWVAGTQKIVKDLETGFRRLWKYCLPLEDTRMKSIGASGSSVGKILLFERERNPNRKIYLIFVDEKLGF